MSGLQNLRRKTSGLLLKSYKITSATTSTPREPGDYCPPHIPTICTSSDPQLLLQSWPPMHRVVSAPEASSKWPSEAHHESGGFWMPWDHQQIITHKELKVVWHGFQENLPFHTRSGHPTFSGHHERCRLIDKIQFSHQVLDGRTVPPSPMTSSSSNIVRSVLYPLRAQHRGPSVLSSKCGPVESQTEYSIHVTVLLYTRHHPPWHLLPQVLFKMKDSHAKGVVVYPRWSLQSWYTEFEVCNKAIYHLPSPYTCVHPHHPDKVEQRFRWDWRFLQPRTNQVRSVSSILHVVYFNSVLQDTTSSYHVSDCACLAEQLDFYSREDSGELHFRFIRIDIRLDVR